MPPDDLRFPFSAIVGLEDCKHALTCALANRDIRTVLIRGGTGSAKSTVARAIPCISDRKIITVPLNVTDEQLFGGMDLEATLKEGKPVIQKGLLSRADGNVVYVDDINLLDQRISAGLLDCVLNGSVILEREGISGSYECDTLLIATMDPTDNDLSSHMLDRFDLCAYIAPIDDEERKSEIVKSNLSFQNDPALFTCAFREKDAAVKESIRRASLLLPYVTVSDELMRVAVELVVRMNADGMRGDIALIRTAKTLAALDDRDEVLRKDIEDAAMICLPHRRNYIPEPPPQESEPDDDREPPEQPSDNPPDDDNKEEPDEQDNERDDIPPPDVSDISDMLDDMMFEIGEQFRVIDYLGNGKRRIRTTSSKKGRRQVVESRDMSGRYAGSRMSDEMRDIAFDATIRAAAPHQKGREHSGLAVEIRKDDVRRKVRETRAGCTIMFLVDASGSIGVRRRMAAVKGAVLSMLRDSYVKRDRVGMMAFRRDSAELILPPTRSVEYSYKRLEDLPTGGKTPLAEALVTVEEFMTSYSRTHAGEMCYIVMITDGRANVPFREGADANKEVLELAERMSIPQVRWIVIDASTGYVRFDNAERLAVALEGTYFKLEDLNADRLADSVKSVIDRS